MKKENNVVFKKCGWTTCGFTIFGRKPNREYAVWIPSLISPFSILSPFQSQRTCLSSILGLRYNLDTNSKTLNLMKAKAVRILAMRYSKKTRQKNECGFELVSNFLPVANFLSPAKYKVLNKLKNELVYRGYKLGVNAVALPYDWREAFAKNDASKRLKKLVQTMAEISQKKIILVAHSIGNMNLMNQLGLAEQSFVDRYILRYFAIAPPYIGAPTAVHYMLAATTFSTQSD